MSTREEIIAALDGSDPQTGRQLIDQCNVDNEAAFFMMLKSMTEEGVLNRKKAAPPDGGRPQYLYTMGKRASKAAPSSATPTADALPPASPGQPAQPVRRGGRKTGGITAAPHPAGEVEQLEQALRNTGHIEFKLEAPADTLELAIWNNGAVQIVHGNDSMLLPKDKVDQLKRFIDKLYAITEAEA